MSRQHTTLPDAKLATLHGGKTHVLKTDPELFLATMRGIRPFEIRKNDRNYKPGDELILLETVHTGSDMLDVTYPLEYTGRYIRAGILYILKHSDLPYPALYDDWCVMAVNVIYTHTSLEKNAAFESALAIAAKYEEDTNYSRR